MESYKFLQHYAGSCSGGGGGVMRRKKGGFEGKEWEGVSMMRKLEDQDQGKWLNSREMYRWAVRTEPMKVGEMDR